jgi:type II secretory pathway pseudopilin PulG
MAVQKTERIGFTLIELLAVMTIMIILAAIAVTSYIALVQGAAARSAVSHLRASCMLARQAAIMNGRRAHVIITQADGRASYVICTEEGVATAGSGGAYLVDEFNNLGAMVVNSPIYNLTRGTRWYVQSTLIAYDDVYAVQTKDSLSGSTGGDWAVGDAYGWESHPKTMLPKGFLIDESNSDEHIVFKPDGTTGNAMLPYTVRIYEEEVGLSTYATIEISPAGKIRVEGFEK